jgi:hypothetical protein
VVYTYLDAWQHRMAHRKAKEPRPVREPRPEIAAGAAP